jgi:hypothetical protein
MSIVAGQVPAIGYQGTARISVTDGVATATIDIPINIAARVDSQGQSLYETDFVRTQSIAWQTTTGAIWSVAAPRADLDLVWNATIGAIFGNAIVLPGVYDDEVDLGQSIDMEISPLASMLGSIAIGQTVADGYSDGIVIDSVDLSQSIDIGSAGIGEMLGAVSLGQSIAITQEVAAVVVTESAVLAGLTYSQSTLLSGLSAASQASMTDGLGHTFTATDTALNQWIECNFSSRSIRGVRVGGGGGSGFSFLSPSLNGAAIQTWDGSAWVTAGSVAGVANSGGAQFITFYFPIVTTTKIRLLRSGYLATSELYPIETTATTEAATLTGLTLTQSSVYSGTSAATQASMTDGVGATFAATNNAGDQWIECNFSSRSVAGVRVGGGNGAGWGSIASYLNTVAIQTWDGAAWVNAGVVAGVGDGGGTQFATIYFPIVTTTKVRLFRSGNYISTSELYPITAT